MGFEKNEVKFDSLNKKNVVYCELLYRPSESGEFDEKIESSSVKVQEVENYMDDGLKKEDQSPGLSKVMGVNWYRK